ncbi:MAG: 23S rRNA (adenine(2503)-C(2))-methyltransferase RlmN, partial [Deltaproteobacteria bacterium]|nr:23S rRNA (adenine(2503)-C(2))-methyltransferase RlmN [Deltaproteobacteria bacterium]
AFCMTGMGGFTRNLLQGELTGQVFAAMGLIPEGRRITNVVLMGMGEPLANYDNVVSFVNILTDERAFNFSRSKVTISTCGIVPAIKRLMDDTNVNLAVSLNATTDEVRTRLMPINRKYPIDELLDALRRCTLKGKRYVTVEYILMKGVNDTDEDAGRLVRMLRGIKCKINLIPFNPFPGARFECPDEKRVEAFWKTLHKAGYTVIVRYSKGIEIQAACGTLQARYSEPSG